MVLPDKLAVKFFSPAVEENELLVRELEGVEELSRLFRFDIELYSENPNIDLAAILKDPVWLGFRHGVALSGDSRGIVMRKIHGVLASFEQLDPIKSWHRYRAVLVPKLWRSTLTSNSRIFMKKPIPKFTEDILKESGLSGDDYSFKSVHDADDEVEYVTQYQETDFNFVSRWWEDEGIAYRFDHSDERATLALFNSDSAYVPVEGDTTAVYNPTALPDQELQDEEWLRPPVVGTFLCRQKTIPRKMILSDYNYRTPSTKLKVEHDVDSQDGAGTLYEYSSHYKDAEEGKAVAEVRAERLLCTKKVFSGASDAKGFRPGATFSLEKHPRENFNQEYLLVKVRHQARQSLGSGTGSAAGASYRNEFECIESGLTFRPERVSTWPIIPGLMNAKVDDASDGKYAEIDEQGRYNVKLPIDLTEVDEGQSSRRMRMAQPYAGPNGTNPSGMHFPLHKKTEVLLGCIDGDPDRPIILNAVPNPESSSPVYNEHQTQCVIRTGSGNEISLEDEEDQEGILTYTPKHKSFTQLGAHMNDEIEGVSSKTEGSFMAASKDDWNAATEANLEAQAKGHIDIHSHQSTCIYAVKPPANPLWKKILKLIFRNEDEGEHAMAGVTKESQEKDRKAVHEDVKKNIVQTLAGCKAVQKKTNAKKAAKGLLKFTFGDDEPNVTLFAGDTVSALAKKGLLLGSGKETHIFAKKGFQVYSPKAVSLNGTKDGVEIKQSPMNFIMIDKKLFEARCGADGVINIGKQLDIKAEHVTFGEPKDGKGEMPAKKETPRKGRLTSWRAYTENTLIGDSNNTIVLHTGKSKSEGYWIQLHEKDGICLRKGPKKNDYPQIILTDKMVSVSFNKDVRCRVNKKSAMLWNKGTKVNVFDKKIQIEGKKVEVNGKTMVVS